MKDYTEHVMVTDWDKVDIDDFYLTDDEWAKSVDPETLARAKELQAEGHLYFAYVIPAVHYVIYHTMDSAQIFIDEDGDEIMSCESEIIDNTHKQHFEYSY